MANIFSWTDRIRSRIFESSGFGSVSFLAPLGLLLLNFLWVTSVVGLKELYKWKTLRFEWNSERQKQRFIAEGRYVENASTPIDVLIHNEIFLAIPRNKGVPAALTTLNRNKDQAGEPLLRPYPDWSWTGSNCDRNIVSVYRLDLDDCERLWVLDNGKYGEDQYCPPKILAFDLHTRKLLLKKVIPNKYAFNKNGTGLLVTPLVKSHGKACDKITMYMADIEGYGLVVWDGKDGFRRFDSEVFGADDPNFDLNGYKFYLADGIVGLALTKGSFNDSLFFSSLGSRGRVFHVPEEELKIGSDKTPTYVEHKGDVNFHKVSLVIDKETMYFSSLEDNALRSWDIRSEFVEKNTKVIAQNRDVLQFVSGMKMRKAYESTNGCKRLYGLSNRYQRVITGTLDTSEYNYRIFEEEICH